jgi:hypothetical protein
VESASGFTSRVVTLAAISAITGFGFLRAFGWIELNSKCLLYGALGALVIVVGWILWARFLRSN